MLGTGVNAQQRAVAVHHLEIPWVLPKRTRTFPLFISSNSFFLALSVVAHWINCISSAGIPSRTNHYPVGSDSRCFYTSIRIPDACESAETAVKDMVQNTDFNE